MRLNTEAHAAQPTVISASTELATISAIPAIVPAEFFKPNGADAVLSALKTEVRKVAATLDISTPGGREAIASLAYKVARSKTALDEQGKELVGAIKKQSGEIDAERKRVAAQKKSEAEEAEKRAKNKAHRLKIDNEALGAIVALDIPMDRAQDLLIAIAKGAVPHVSIQY